MVETLPLPAANGAADRQRERGALAGEDTPKSDIIVFGRAHDQIRMARSGSQGTVGFADPDKAPIARIGGLVDNAPAVVPIRHSGIGKANKVVLRGFNLEYDTDFAGFVGSVPLTVRTHGHGQGYRDFNCVIPETLDQIDFHKGPAFADIGDFGAMGTIAFQTRDPNAPFARIEAGPFGFACAVNPAGSDVPN